MKKSLFLGVICVFLSACSSPIPEKDLVKLNGYWEIAKAEHPEGEPIDYKASTTVDYIQIKGKSGFRQKVMPQLDGTFRTNTLQERITLKDSNATWYVHYQTDYGRWKEAIVKLTDSVLVLKNDDNIEYRYKKFKPFSRK
jgi:hypothetical protein